ncbi:Tfp pilus assembly protein PilF, partial [Spirosoma oryzae]
LLRPVGYIWPTARSCYSVSKIITKLNSPTRSKAFINASRSKYNHFAYVQIDSSFTESIINSLKYINPNFEYNSTISPEENLIILFQNIKQISNSLLILDGVNDDNELRKYKVILEGLNWNVLITSRTIPDSYKENNITVNHLPEVQALDLFRANYGREDEVDENAVKRILLKINFHTKLIILLAKAAQNNPLLQLEELANKVYNEDYKDENVNIDITVDNEENSVFQFILLLFEPNELSDEQKLYLRYFTVLPNQEIPVEILVKLFEKDTKQGYFINTINKLTQKGWIEKNGTFYSIHPIVRLVIKNKISFSIDFFTPLILNSEYYLRNSTSYIENGIYLSYGESIVNFFSDDRYELGLVCNRISLIYMGLHDMPRSIMYCERAIKIFELYGNISEILAQAYGNLGVIHNINREFEKAEISLLKALEIQREILPETHHDIASTYSNLGGVYQGAARSSQNPEVAMRYYQASLDLYSNALSIQEKRLTNNGEKRDAHNLAIGYNNVAMIYDDLFRRYNNFSYEKMSIEYDKKSLNLLLDYFGEEYPLTARSFNNNGLTFLRGGQLDEAREYIEKGLQIRVKILPDNHPDIGNSFYNLARVMIEQGFDSKEKIKETLLSAIDIMQKLYDPNHPTLNAAQALLIEQG